jgi:hypothetical protein
MLLKHSVCHCLDVRMVCVLACITFCCILIKNVSCQCNKQDMHHVMVHRNLWFFVTEKALHTNNSNRKHISRLLTSSYAYKDQNQSVMQSCNQTALV